MSENYEVNAVNEEVMDMTPETDTYAPYEEQEGSSGIVGYIVSFVAGGAVTWIACKLVPKVKNAISERKEIRLAKKEAEARAKEEIQAAKEAEAAQAEDTAEPVKAKKSKK